MMTKKQSEAIVKLVRRRGDVSVYVAADHAGVTVDAVVTFGKVSKSVGYHALRLFPR